MTDIWSRLKSCRQAQGNARITSLFDADADRATAFSTRADVLLFDWSKTMIDADARDLLLDLARNADVVARREAMFGGEKINETEGRAVLHTALRNLSGSVSVDGQDVMPQVRQTYDRMAAFANDVRSGAFAGQGGKITDVVNAKWEEMEPTPSNIKGLKGKYFQGVLKASKELIAVLDVEEVLSED